MKDRLLLALLLFPVCIHAQERVTVKGKIINEQGEEAFRRIESDTLRDLGKLSGVVIATGGGAVTREDNFAYLRQNSVVVWLRRDIEALSAEGRPLSQALGTEKLYSERKTLYERFADTSAEVFADSEQTARAILNSVKVYLEDT